MRYLIFISLLLLTLPVNAELYRRVDKHGNVHFSDKPLSENAESYTPPPIQTVPATAPATYNFKKKTPDKKKAAKYKSIEITAPSDGQIFTPDQTASIAVQTSLEPGLQTNLGHQLAIYLDGKRHDSFTLEGLPRGTHTVYAAVVGAKDKIIKQSKPVSFHVQKHSL